MQNATAEVGRKEGQKELTNLHTVARLSKGVRVCILEANTTGITG